MSTPRRAGASAAPSDTPNSGLRSRTNTSPKRSALEAANGTGNDASSASNGSASNSANGNIKPPSSQSQSNSTISNYISTLMALARLKMAVFSAVTYSAAFTLGLRLAQSTSSGSVFDYETFIFGWLFMFTCQLSAHLLGEYYDLPSDSLNKGGPFTGGSKVLVAGRGDPKLALYWGWVATACAMTLLVTFVPRNLYPLAIAMLTVAHQYSAPPLLLNHRGLGEICASVIMNLATPLYAIFLANPGLVDPDLRSGIGAVFADGTARLLLIPPFFNKVALLLMLNIADRLPDWATGKRTLAVILGDDPAVRLHLFLMILATLSIMWSLETGPLSFVPFPPVTGAPVFLFTAVLAGIVPGLGISLDASKYLPDPSQHAATTKWKPEVVRSVKQAPYPVLALFFYLLTEQFFARGPLFLLAPDLHVRLLPLYVFAYNILSAPRPPPPPPASATWTPPQEPVLIAGAGPCGLGLYIALRGMGFNARLFERRLQAKDLGTGADVGLWPGAVEILKSYGVGMSDDDLTWWSRETWPVHRVEMVRGDGGKIRDVDMDIVNPPSWGSFRLIGRRPLMSELVELVGEGNIEFGKEVVSYEVDEHGVVVEVAGPNGTEKIRGFMLLGADGIGSNVRKMLRGKAERARYAGEVCHRGVIELDNVPNNSPLREILKSADGTMKLIYGTGWRGSYGVIGQNAGYWWFKHPLASSSADHLSQDLPTAEQTKEWPAPFAGLVKGTGAEGYYVEPVLDRTEAWDWGGEKGRIVCAGDAAHPVTPNMAQGCTTSLTDSLLLPILLRRFLPLLPTPLSLLEAQYQFHSIRAPHVGAVAKASYIQAKVGQWKSAPAVAFREFAMKKIPMEKGLAANREERTVEWIAEWLGYCREADALREAS